MRTVLKDVIVNDIINDDYTDINDEAYNSMNPFTNREDSQKECTQVRLLEEMVLGNMTPTPQSPDDHRRTAANTILESKVKDLTHNESALENTFFIKINKLDMDIV